MRCALLFLILAGAAVAVEPAQQTLVVYNEREPTARELAYFYAEKRGIPEKRIVALACPTTEEITRAEYDETIAGPLRAAMNERQLWKIAKFGDEVFIDDNSIRYIALIRGMPLKIAATQDYPGDQQQGTGPIATRNEASVDAELSALALHNRVISGALNNPYFRSYTRIGEAKLPALMLVARLDAPTTERARRMILDSLEAERHGLWGFAYIDTRGLKDGGHIEGDRWILAAAQDAREHGIPVIADAEPATFPVGYPMRHAALYLGWYTENVDGPFTREDFTFERGAVAVHLHSFSAASLRDPLRGWAAPLLWRGAAATLGNVYEPYLGLTAHLDIFENRLRSGYTLAEAAYMAQPALSWMNVVVGDPLYRPYRVVPRGSAALEKSDAEWIAYREGAKLWHQRSRGLGETALVKSARSLRSGVIWEGLADLQLTANDPPSALSSLREAREAYRDIEDGMRAALREISLLRTMRRKKDALALVRSRMNLAPDSPTMPLLRAIANELEAPPPIPTATAIPVPQR